MNENRTKNTIRNIIWGLINKIVVLFFPFIIRTILIKKLGSEYLGLNSLFTSILQVLNLTELGFSSAIVFSMYKPIAENDTDTICALMNLYKKIYRIIGIIILAVGLSITPFIPKLINGSYPSDINIYILYFIYLFNTAITYFLFAYKSALLTAYQRSDITSNVNTVVFIIQYAIQIIILCVWKDYYAYILVNTFMNILNNLLVAIITKRKYPAYVCKGVVSQDTKNDIKKRVYGLMIQKICATTRNSLDSIFLSVFLGLNIVAIYSNYYTIMNAIIGILGILTTSMVASIGNSIVTETVEKNYNDMNKFNFVYMWISGWCAVCMLCLYQPFMKLWMGENLLFPLSSVVFIVLYFYGLKMGDILSSYTQATGLWYEGRYRALAETILNIVLNYFLGKLFGVNGIILATLISLILINFGYGSVIIFKYYFKNISIKNYYKRHFFYFVVTCFSCLVTYKICEQIDFSSVWGLIIKGLICIIMPNLIFVLCYCKYDMFYESKNFIKHILYKKIKKGE